ncbi:GTPase [Candidatus Micrarchaeota archaeon]|nr:GTPase [Candidatus Micrarchaeota archaeon]
MRKVLILGAAGRDFHNFNVFFRNKKDYEVLGFTATQVPNIANRRYPPELAGELYPNGIPIYDEEDLEKLIKEHDIYAVYFSYSDVSHEYVMHLASRTQAAGASFVLLGPRETMLKSNRKVIAVTGIRTGVGKTTLTRKISSLLRQKHVIIRHPMPYGDLTKQIVQRFQTKEDLERYNCTVEEREEYEPHIKGGDIVYAGVDYEKLLAEAEKEAEVIIWDGGNNDMPFIKPDLHFVVCDALRPGQEMWYYPGETNFRAADVVVINKSSENPTDVKRIMKNIEKANPGAMVIEADMELTASEDTGLYGKKVIVVEDGPTVTHGGMKFGAGYEYAARAGADIIDPRPFAVGTIKEAYAKYEHMGDIVPSLGYYGKQIEELSQTINNSDAEIVISGTPIAMKDILKTQKPVIDIDYHFCERTGSLKKAIEKFLG